MNLPKPAERQLPNKQAVLDRVLADEAPHTRRWLSVVAAAASVGVIAGGTFAVTNLQSDSHGDNGLATAPRLPTTRPPSSPSSTTSAQRHEPVERSVQLNIGPLSPAVAQRFAAACERFMKVDVTDPAYSHAIKIDGGAYRWIGLTLVITDRATHDAYACSGGARGERGNGSSKYEVISAGFISGPDAATYKSVVNPTDATHPAAPTDLGGFSTGIYLDNRPDSVVPDGWYRVDERVASMRQRILVNGHPTPWYVADAVDGTVYQTSWLTSTVLHKGDLVRVETQVLGADGQLLDAPADQRNGGGLAPSPGTTSVDSGTVTTFGFGHTRGASVNWK